MILNLPIILTFNATLFSISILGIVLNRNSVLGTIICLELMLLSVNLNFIVASIYLDDAIGNIFVIFILTVAATESSIGLAILTIYYRLKNTTYFEKVK